MVQDDRPFRARGAAALLGLVAAATACEAPPDEQRLDAYRDAVWSLVAPERAVPETPSMTLRLPERRERRLPVAETRIGLLDFLTLQGCRLGQLVAQRNTLLGRVMPPSRRLVYELDVLEAADVCLPELGEQRREQLGALLERKRANLPRHVWNAVWEKSELSDYLSVSGDDPAWWVEPERSATDVLDEIAQLLERRTLAARDARRLERALEDLRGLATAGALLWRLERARFALETVSAAVDAVAEIGCGATRRGLREAFEAHYVGRVQPDLAVLDREAEPVIAALGRIYRASRPDLPPPSMEGFYAEALSLTEGVWPGYRAAVVEHMESWGATLEACDAS